MANQEIKRAARAVDVPYWRIGRELGVSEATIQRMLRTELSDEDRQRIMEAIQRLERETEES